MNHRPLRVFVPSFLIWAVLLLLPAVAMAQEEVVVTVKPQKAAVMPGDTLAVAVVFDHQEGWHIHTNDPVPPPGVSAWALIATVIEPKAHPLASYREIQWPKGKAEKVDLGMGPTDYVVFGGRAIAFVPIEISPEAAPGSEITLEFTIEYQACNDQMCLMPEMMTERVVLPVVTLEQAAAMQGGAGIDRDFANFDPAVFALPADGVGQRRAAGPAPQTTIDLAAFGLEIPLSPDSRLGILALIVVGFVGGFILNLTPCVLPVIPIKIMGLSQAAAGSPGRCFLLGAVMSLGLTTFWVAIGASIALLGILGSTPELFGLWWFTLSVGLFVGVMGLGMMGLFTVQLPQAVYRVSPRHDTLAGSFLFGIMTAILGLPCFAPFMGGATAAALTVSPWVALATFGAIGAGMAFPYLVLSARPKWIDIIPRTGPASELIKQVMGLLLVAAAAFFVGTGLISLVSDHPYLGRVLHLWGVALFGGVAGLLLVMRTFQITKAPQRRAIFGGIGAALVAVSALVAFGSTTSARHAYLNDAIWERYTPAAYQAAIDNGNVVVLNFTAEWCITCHFLKRTVLNRHAVQRSLVAEGVVPFTVDLTSRGDPGWEKLTELGERGIPLLYINGPSGEPFKSNAYTVDQVVAAIKEARGTGKPVAGGVPVGGVSDRR